MTNKRFTLHIDWYNYEKTEGKALLSDDGQPMLVTESIDDARLVKKVLNDLNDENEELKEFIRKEFPKSHKHILEGIE